MHYSSHESTLTAFTIKTELNLKVTLGCIILQVCTLLEKYEYNDV